MVRDVRGVKIPTEAPPKRVVSLVPSDTYTLFALGAEDQLAGRTQFCVHPKERVGDIPSIGGTKTPNIQKIIALKPDLILANREENRLEDIQAVEAAGVPVYVSQPRVVGDSPALVRDIGALLHHPEAAEEIALAIEGEIGESKARGASPLACLYFIWRGPYMGIGSDTYIYDSLTLAGFKPLAPAGALRYPELAEGFIKNSKAQACLFPSEPFLFRERHIEAFGSAFPDLPAVQLGACSLISGEDPSWHGAWALKGIPALRRLRANFDLSQQSERTP